MHGAARGSPAWKMLCGGREGQVGEAQILRYRSKFKACADNHDGRDTMKRGPLECTIWQDGVGFEALRSDADEWASTLGGCKIGRQEGRR